MNMAKKNIEAGLQVALLLRKLGYKQRILCYTGPNYLESNKDKFRKAGLNDVMVTSTQAHAASWAKFENLSLT